ncbi:Putative dipeptidase CPSG_01350 (Part 1) [Syntrophaceticus schinkii]|uniref:Putative dipeptidase CPSG_01350 (Part 1) n=1 Tax=Syntrophaceticus schinkii TaxID=499207 RepID=A0A0B7MJG1_9FIRM|nr:Putative dipeptidase CPSG_01350 (Part 1) [Syntrophaceticus schinkii]
MIIDLHCDTVLKAFQENSTLAAMSPTSHLDLRRMHQAGVKIQFYALFPGIASYMSPLKQALILSDFFLGTVSREPANNAVDHFTPIAYRGGQFKKKRGVPDSGRWRSAGRGSTDVKGSLQVRGP